MKLSKVIIDSFRSVHEKQELIVNDKVTVLIGANDHGKSNILHAIRLLNDGEIYTPEDRHWDVVDTSKPLIEWHFIINNEEISTLRNAIETTIDAEFKPDDVTGAELNTESELPVIDFDDDEAVKRLTFSYNGLKERNWQVNWCNKLVSGDIYELAVKMKPRIELFITTHNVKDEVTLEQLETPEYEFMKGIFLKAGIWTNRDSLFKQTPQTSRLLDLASQRLTEQLSNEWEQGKELQWKFQHAGNNGDIIRLYIEDPAIKSSYVGPSKRSTGFTSFFILSLTIFARTHSNREQSYIFLFDEPGSYLHPIAQVNLQRVFESLSDRSQIIYTTHSIFLVNKNVPTRNRVIRKCSMGTVIDLKPYSGNWKSVRDTLGIMLTHNFLISDRTLLVEGPSDPIYILSAIYYLNRSGRTDIDLNEFSIADAGNERNQEVMTKLMLDEGRDVVLIVDGDSQGDKVKKNIEKIAPIEINNGRLVVLKLPESKSIEDLMPRKPLLFEAVKRSAQFLLEGEQRLWGSENTPDTECANLIIQYQIEGKDKTLGRMLVDLTKSWFKPRESISKLLIATIYEDLLKEFKEDESDLTSDDLLSLIDQIYTGLKLHSRKAEIDILNQSNDESSV